MIYYLFRLILYQKLNVFSFTSIWITFTGHMLKIMPYIVIAMSLGIIISIVLRWKYQYAPSALLWTFFYKMNIDAENMLCKYHYALCKIVKRYAHVELWLKIQNIEKSNVKTCAANLNFWFASIVSFFYVVHLFISRLFLCLLLFSSTI